MLRQMLVLFYPPFRADDETELAALAVDGLMAYADDLAAFDEPTLKAAWAEVRREHKFERWPTIRAILDSCQRFAARSEGAAPTTGVPAWAQTWAKATGAGRVMSYLRDVTLEPTEPTATLWCRSGFIRDMLGNDQQLILDGVRAAHPKVTALDLIARDDPKRRAA